MSIMARTEKKIAGYIEDGIILSRYLLVPLSFALVYQILIIGVDFYRVQFGAILEERLTEHTLVVLQLVDIMMIANFVWLIAAGSYYVFVDKKESGKKRPRCLEHISSGILKEKMAGSLIGVSSVHLLQSFLHLAKPEVPLDWPRLFAMLIIHCSFIVGLIAFCWTNSAPHHNHDDKKEPHEALRDHHRTL